MSKQFRPYDPHQQYLFPPSLSDWVPEGHIARFVGDVVDNLDLSAILVKYERQVSAILEKRVILREVRGIDRCRSRR